MKQKKVKCVVCFLMVLIFVLTCAPVTSQAAHKVKRSEDYVEGKYKYYFESDGWEGDVIYFCRSKKDGSKAKVLCKVKSSNLDAMDMQVDRIEINGHYKNRFYCSMEYVSCGTLFGVVDTKDKTIKVTQYPGLSKKISKTKYLLNTAQNMGDWCIMPTYVFDIKKNKYTLLAEYCDISVVVENDIIYLKSSYDAASKVHSAIVFKYNLKTGKKTKLKKLDRVYIVSDILQNYLVYTDSEASYSKNNLKIIDFGKATTKLADGTYSVDHLGNQKYSGENGIYKAKISNNKLIIYGNFKKGKKSLKDAKYELEIHPECKLYHWEYPDGINGIKVTYPLESFNGVYDNFEQGISFNFQVKRGKVCKIIPIS